MFDADADRSLSIIVVLVVSPLLMHESTIQSSRFIVLGPAGEPSNSSWNR